MSPGLEKQEVREMVKLGFHRMNLRNIDNISVIRCNKALSVSKCAHLTAGLVSQFGEGMRSSGR